MRGKLLTEEQKGIIRDNQTRWADDICRMDGMDGVTPRQVRDYIKRLESKPDDTAQLISTLETYICNHGLPRQYGIVMEYLNYLKR